MNTIFHKQIRKMVECYVDDIVVKSHATDDHIAGASIEDESHQILPGDGQR